MPVAVEDGSGSAESGGARTPGIGFRVLRGNWEAKCENVEMEFGRKFSGWREDGENGEAARAQDGFYGLASATRGCHRG
jgi:hypothetical protein